MDVCACFHLRKASRAVTHLYDETLAPAGLRSTGFLALATTASLGAPTLPQLTRALALDRSTLTRNLRPLLEDGLLRSFSRPGSRALLVQVTPKGHKAIARCVPLWKQAQARIETSLGPAQWAKMRSALESVAKVAK